MLVENIASVAVAHPDKPAIIDRQLIRSYSELWRGVNSWANIFETLACPGGNIALLLDNSHHYVECYYGIWQAGYVVVALNTELSTEEILAQLAHCGAKALVVSSKAKQLESIRQLNASILNIIEIDLSEPNGSCFDVGATSLVSIDSVVKQAGNTADSEDIKNASAGRAEVPDLASIIYTSGTTGQPKGVMLSHQNITTNVHAICDSLSIRPDDKVMCTLPFYYSYGNSVLHSHLSVGATLVLHHSLMYPKQLLEKMVTERVTTLVGVPTTYYLLLSRAHLGEYDFTALRYCTQAGGNMRPEKIDEFRELLPSVDFIVMYGQTEASARLTCLPAKLLATKRGSVGLPITGVMLKVVDASGVEVAAGKTGEVLARGGNVMQGYWSDPVATRKVLHGGWLRTGDLGYLDDEGYLFLQGRSSEIIKSGAHRITPHQIEEVIESLPGVERCAVIGVPDDFLGEVVKACVVVTDYESLEQNETEKALLVRTIKKCCRDQLAAYKVPKKVDFYAQFPATASGKVKKFLLN